MIFFWRWRVVRFWAKAAGAAMMRPAAVKNDSDRRRVMTDVSDMARFSAASVNKPLRAGSGVDLEDRLDFHGKAARQLEHADGAAGVLARFGPEQFEIKIGRAVDHGELPLKPG